MTGGRPARIAALTRAAYQDSDPLPGLPVPDGARETEAAVRADVERGATVWLATDGTGEPTGALRVTEAPDGAWKVDRVSVLPAVRGRGVARALLDAVDAAATEHGVPAIRLDAVVERCLPSLYARLGFRAVLHWPADDKPLTEVTMERRPGAAVRPHARPWVRPAAEPGTLLVVWLRTADALIAAMGDGYGGCPAAAAFPGARLAGADLWRGAGPGERDALLRWLGAHGRRVGAEAVGFAPDRAALRAHVMPRTVDPRLHAWCRFRPGAEPLIDQAEPPSSRTAHRAVPTTIPTAVSTTVPTAVSTTVPTDAVRCM